MTIPEGTVLVQLVDGIIGNFHGRGAADALQEAPPTTIRLLSLL